MKIAKTVNEVRKIRNEIRGNVGFIPTMGYLHQGHISLVRRAKKENDFVFVSIFVNPKQFGPTEDYLKYPRDTNRDIQLLEPFTDCVFLPSVSELYPTGFDTGVSVSHLSNILEGEKRPGHFDGVCTVLTVLFNSIQPDVAYFGQKDAQQIAVIKKMVSDLQMPIRIARGETIREKDGLAMSSRNIFLTKPERKNAVCLFQSLQLAQQLYSNGERTVRILKEQMAAVIKNSHGKIDYISIADPATLEEVTEITKTVLISCAVYMGKTRLLDNIILSEKRKN